MTGSGANRTYTPAANYNGPDSITFTVGDGTVVSPPATITITVTPVNDAPVANSLTVSATTAQPASVTLSGSDVDGDTLTFVIVTSPAHGTLTGTAPSLTYTSAAGFAGADSFTYAVSDGVVQSQAGVVSITVTAPPSALGLSVADNASRTANVRPLAGTVLRSGVSRLHCCQHGAVTGVRQVSFALDGAAFPIDRAAPFDFAGTTNTRSCRSCVLDAYPFESNLLSLGTHHITVSALLRDGTRVAYDASFTVADTTPHSIAVSTSSSHSASIALDGATLSGQRFIFLADANDSISGLSTVAFQLDGKTLGTDPTVPYDAVPTRHGVSALDTRSAPRRQSSNAGDRSIVGGGEITYIANFRVNN